MKTTSAFINFLGWASLTYIWLEVNHLFFCAIINAIHDHDEQIRQKALEDESEDENEDE